MTDRVICDLDVREESKIMTASETGDHAYSDQEREEFSAGWDAEDRQLRAEAEAEDARFAALPDAEQQEEAGRRGWSLAAQEPEEEAGMAAGA